MKNAIILPGRGEVLCGPETVPPIASISEIVTIAPDEQEQLIVPAIEPVAPHKELWVPDVAEGLEKQGLEVVVPKLPEPGSPTFAEWEEVFTELEPDEDTAVIAHDNAANFLITLLSKDARNNEPEDRIQLGTTVLVSPARNHEAVGDFYDNYRRTPEICDQVGRLVLVGSLNGSAASIVQLRKMSRLYDGELVLVDKDATSFRDTTLSSEMTQIVEEILADEVA
jgi:predicted alpha/beta hydrolase family esterase